jgi:hypothetical protein
MTLRGIFQQAKRRALPHGWLYLPADTKWSPATEGHLLDLSKEELDADETPLIAKRLKLQETLDVATIEQAVDWADQLAGKADDSARLEIFTYYVKFDAFPNTLGAPDPPPVEDVINKRDRQFYDSLGAERPGTKCRHDGCNRGTTRLSVFCRIHQFEQVKKKPCPFQD